MAKSGHGVNLTVEVFDEYKEVITKELLGGNDEAFQTFREHIADVQKKSSVAANAGANKNKEAAGGVHPIEIRNLKQLKEEIAKAKASGKKVRVVGGYHSIPEAIASEPCTLLYLAGDFRTMEHVNTDEAGAGDDHVYIKVGGGCHLGINPDDFSHLEEERSALGNSFNYQIDSWGYSLPILGGITQQTVSGFLMTGSAGGSLTHSLCEAVHEIEFLNGNFNGSATDPKWTTITTRRPKGGEAKKKKKEDGKGKQEGKRTNKKIQEEDGDLWNAVGVSMGLYGVITSITFKISKRYLLEGNEITEPFTKSSLFRDGKPCLEKSLRENEYYRSLWYPQNGAVLSWDGKQAKTFFKDVKEYVNELSVAPFLAQVALQILDYMIKNRRETGGIFPESIYNFVIQTIFNQFIKVSDTPSENVKPYCDLWYKTIPTDEKIPVDDRMKMVFTETWLPMKHANTTVAKLKAVFDADTTLAHNTPVEFYGSKKSDFWMSPSNKEDMIRVDAFWYDKNINTNNERDAFYKVFWDELVPLSGVCHHWGKYLPAINHSYGGVVYDKNVLLTAFPRMKEWNEKRKEHDRDGLFLTNYWNTNLIQPIEALATEK